MGASDVPLVSRQGSEHQPRDGAATRSTLGYLPALDGLRALAVAAVVAYHLGLLRGGFLGVDVFFVISGFLITRLLLAERDRAGRIDLRSFWVRRFKRLVPALLVVLSATAVASRLWLPAWRLTDIRNDALGALAYVANWRFVASDQSYFATGAAPSPLRHTWSLAIEEQLYVLWPLAVVLAMWLARAHLRRAVGTIAAVLAVASASWMALAPTAGLDLSRIYYGTDTRAFALLAGAWLASWWDPMLARPESRSARRVVRRRWALAGSVALVPLAVAFAVGDSASEAFYRGGFQAVALLAIVVVAGVAADQGPLTTVLGHPVLVWVGRRSYGIYLWSWPIQVMATEHFRLTGAPLHLTVAGSSVVLAALSYRFVEEPIRTGRSPFASEASAAPTDGARRRVPGVAMAALGVVAVVAVVGTASGAPAPPEYLATDTEELSPQLDALDERERDLLEGEAPVVDQAAPLPADGPLLVDPTASVDAAPRLGRPLRAMVTGDSVGWSLGQSLQPGLDPGIEVDGRGVIGCGLMPAAARYVVGDRAGEAYFDHCADAEAFEVKGLLAEPDVVLVWIGAWEVYDQELDGATYEVGTDAYAELLEDRLQTRVDRIRAVGAVAVMPVVPCFGTPAAFFGEERTTAERVQWVNERIRAVAERNAGWVRLIDPSAVLCDDGTARTTTPDGVPLREDGTHFDPPAAVWFWNTWLAGQLGAAIQPEA